MLLTALRVGAAGVGFLTQIVLARLLNADELGIFYFVSSVAMIAPLVLCHGYPSLLTRFVSRYTERGKPEYVSAFLRLTQKEGIKWGVLGALVLATVGWFAPGIEDRFRAAFLFGSLTIIPMCLYRIYGGIAGAYRMFVGSYLPSLVVLPTVFSGVLFTVYLAGGSASLTMVSALQFASWACVAAVSLYIVREIYRGPAEPVYDRRVQRRWAREAWPVVVVAIFTSMLTDLAVILATPFMTLPDVAAFGLCLKVAFLVGFFVQVSHQVLLPDMGDAVARRESGSIGVKILGASLAPLALTVGGFLLSVFFGEYMLGLFGDEFRGAKYTLAILMFAQFVRAVAGPGPLLLTVKGAQGTNAMICAVSALVLIAGNAIMAPRWGAEGAALALLLTTVFWLVATAFALYRMDGVRADLASFLVRRTSVSPAE